MQRIIIIGAGALGREVIWLIEGINKSSPQWDICGFYDDNRNLIGTVISGVPVLGTIDDCHYVDGYVYVLAFGDSTLRAKIAKRLNINDSCFPNLIHPSVIYSSDFVLGHGNIIFPGVKISVNCMIESFNLLYMNVVLGHDVEMGSYNSLYASVSIGGSVSIGREVTLGAGSTTKQSLSIKDNAYIGAGAVVINDVASDLTVVGVPARPIIRSGDNGKEK